MDAVEKERVVEDVGVPVVLALDVRVDGVAGPRLGVLKEGPLPASRARLDGLVASDARAVVGRQKVVLPLAPRVLGQPLVPPEAHNDRREEVGIDVPGKDVTCGVSGRPAEGDAVTLV